jgi:hypothetical protein
MINPGARMSYLRDQAQDPTVALIAARRPQRWSCETPPCSWTTCLRRSQPRLHELDPSHAHVNPPRKHLL